MPALSSSGRIDIDTAMRPRGDYPLAAAARSAIFRPAAHYVECKSQYHYAENAIAHVHYRRADERFESGYEVTRLKCPAMPYETDMRRNARQHRAKTINIYQPHILTSLRMLSLGHRNCRHGG